MLEKIESENESIMLDKQKIDSLIENIGYLKKRFPSDGTILSILIKKEEILKILVENFDELKKKGGEIEIIGEIDPQKKVLTKQKEGLMFNDGIEHDDQETKFGSIGIILKINGKIIKIDEEEEILRSGRERYGLAMEINNKRYTAFDFREEIAKIKEKIKTILEVL